MNRGLSWGEPVIDDTGVQIRCVPTAQFDLANDITGFHLVNGFYLGDDTGLQHSWTDTDVLDGYEYWYAITAYDYAPPEPVYEAAIGGNPNSLNVVAVIAGARPAGYVEGTVVNGATAGSTIDLYVPADIDYETIISVQLIDQSMITGDDYAVSVTSTGSYGETTYDYLGGIQVRNTTDTADLLATPIIPNSTVFGDDLVPITEGFRVVTVQPNDGVGGIYDLSQTNDVDPDTTYTLYLYQTYLEGDGPASNRANRTGLMNTLEYRFTGFANASGDTNWAVDYFSKALVRCPYELWDAETNTRLWPVLFEFGGGGQWISVDYNIATPVPYSQDFLALHTPGDSEYWSSDPSNPNSRSDWAYVWAFDELDFANALWDVGDVWTLQPYKVLKGYAGTSYTFSTIAPAFEDTLIDLDAIKVVPNPYYVQAEWDQSVNRRKIQFTNVPVDCIIDIYTISGELVASLDHSGSALAESGERKYNSDRIGTVVWNLWTYEFTEAAYGLYIYVLKFTDSTGRERTKIGKFAIIR